MKLEKNTLIRWLDVIALSFASYAVISSISFLSITQKTYQSWLTLYDKLDMVSCFSILMLAAVGLFYFLKDTKILCFSHIKFFKFQFLYPPLYFSAVLSVILFFTIGSLDLPDTTPFKSAAISILYIGFCIVLWFHYNETNQHINETQVENEVKKDFLEWLNSEDPVENDDFELFDRYSHANRLAEKIRNSNKSQQLALVGDFGSGKTSICKIIENEKLNKNEFSFIYVDGWGVSDTSCAALILESIVNKLFEYVDCSGIKNIPKKYYEALSGIEFTGSKSILSFMDFYVDPQALLEKIDTIISTLNLKIVIVLEDFDRNSKGHEITNELASLLDRIKNLNNMHFILCVGVSVNSEILNRVSIHREDIKPINSNLCISKVVELMKQEAIKRNIDIFTDSDLDEKYSLKRTCQLMDTLISNPRELKYILRRVVFAWDKLAGEVNYFELITLNIIRYSAPEILRFIDSNIEKFRSKISDEDRKNILKERLIKIIPDDFKDNSNIESIIISLFPNWGSGGYGNSFFNAQRASYIGETDYFKRMYKEELGNDEISDQAFIKDLTSPEADINLLAERISVGEKYIEKFFQLRSFKKEGKLIISSDLTYKVFVLVAHRDASKTIASDDQYKSTKMLSEMCKGFDFNNLFDEVIGIAMSNINYSLKVLNSIKIGHPKLDNFDESFSKIFSKIFFNSGKFTEISSSSMIYYEIFKIFSKKRDEFITLLLHSLEKEPEKTRPIIKCILNHEYASSSKVEDSFSSILHTSFISDWSKHKERLGDLWISQYENPSQ